MPRIRVSTGDNGKILPAGPIIDAAPGAKLEFRAYPDPGYRVKSIILDGEDKGSTPILSFDSVDQDREVGVVFCRTYMNRSSKYTLENRSGGIQIKFVIERNPDSSVASAVKAILYNSSNSLTVQWDTEKGCELTYTTIGSAKSLKDSKSITADIPDGCVRMEVLIQVQGPALSLYVNTPDGKQPGTLFGRLYEGVGAQLAEGWVVAVDGVTSSTTGEYSLDISDFGVVADGKRPLVDSSSYYKAATNSFAATAHSLEM